MLFPLGLLSQVGAPPTPRFVFVGTNSFGGNALAAYRWTDSAGFGTRLSDPSGVTSSVTGVAVNSDSSLVFVSTNDTPYVHAFPFTSASGFGTKFANPSTLPPNSTYDIAQTTGSVAVSHITSPFISAYAFSSGWGTKYADPSTIPGRNSRGVSFNASGNFLAGVGERQNVPDATLYGYTFSGSGFGTWTPNTSHVVNTSFAVSFNPSGSVVAVGSDSSPFLFAYPYSSGWGTKFTDPASPAAYPTGLGWHPTGNAVVTNVLGSPQIAAWPFSSGWGTRFANPATLPPSTGYSADFSRDGGAVAVAHAGSPRVTAYAWSSGFGAKFADPVSLPPNTDAETIRFA